MKIDRKKLKLAIKEAESGKGRWTWKQRQELNCGMLKFNIPPEGFGCTWPLMLSDRQVLYAIAAQARGALSMQKKWIPLCDASGGRKLVEFTKEMQTTLIGSAWKEFKLEEASPPLTQVSLG